MKKPNLKVRITKAGKPNKADFNRVKKYIKENFETIQPGDLQDKNAAKYYSQVKGGKTQGQRNARRLRKVDGTFYNAVESHAIKEEIKDFIKDKQGEITEDEIYKDKELVRRLADFALSGSITLTKESGAVLDFLNRNDFKNITLEDQNGNQLKGLDLKEANFLIRENLRELMRVFKGEKFTSWSRYVVSNAGQDIKVYFFNMEGLEDQTPETIQELLSEEEQAGTFGAYGSPPATKKKGQKNVKTKNSKKSNGQRANKSNRKTPKRK